MGHTEVKAMELDREKIDDSNLVGLYVITIYYWGAFSVAMTKYVYRYRVFLY